MSFFGKTIINGIDESGNLANVKVSSDGHLPVEQGVVVSNLNSSNSNISGLSWYSGLADSTLGVNSIQVVFTCNRNCTIYVDQSSDGTNWEISGDAFSYYYSKGGQSWTIQAVGTYFRTRVYNTSSSATTTFRLSSIMCPWAEPVPRKLSNEGNFKVGVYEIENDYGLKVGISPMSELRTTPHYKLIGSNFSNNFDTNYWAKINISGTGQADVGSGHMIIFNGTTQNSSMLVTSFRSARYMAGSANYFRGVVRCPSGVIPSGTIDKRWGAYLPSDGFYFEQNTSGLALVCRKLGSDSNRVFNGQFNGIFGSEYTLDENVHTYEIIYTNSKAYFTIDGDLLHTFTGSTSPLTTTLNLKCSAEVVAGGNCQTNNTLNIRTMSISRLGEATSRPIYKNINSLGSGVLKDGPGTIDTIVFASKGGNNNYLSLFDSISTATGILYGPLDTSTILTNEISFGGQGLDFYSGLYYQLAGSTTANLTIIYE